MEKLTHTDLYFLVSRIPKDIRALMEKYPSLMIAGGFIRATIAREKVHDIDIFGADNWTLEEAAKELAGLREGKLHTTDNAITVICPPRIPVQFILRWNYVDIEKLIEHFDFTVCQAAIQCKVEDAEPEVENAKPKVTWQGLCHERFYPDLAAHRLYYTSRPAERDDSAGGSLVRMRKFIERGYNIQAGSMAAVVVRAMRGIDLEKLGFIADHNEKHIASMVCKILRQVDPLIMIDGVEMLDEHEIEGGAE